MIDNLHLFFEGLRLLSILENYIVFLLIILKRNVMKSIKFNIGNYTCLVIKFHTCNPVS